MAMTTTCPGCGATLAIDENQTSVTCQFCGNHFAVNLDETTPALQKTAPPPEPPVPTERHAAPDEYNPPIPGTPGQAGEDVYNPPIPGAPAGPRADVYNPPLSDISSSSSQSYSPPPYTAQPEQPLINRLGGSRLWIGIAIAVTVVFCISCLCMVAIARGVFQ